MKLVEFIHFNSSGKYCCPHTCIIWLYFVYVCLGSTFSFSMTMRFYVVTRLLPVTDGIRSAVEEEALADTLLAITYCIFFAPLSSLSANFELLLVFTITFRRKDKNKPTKSFRSVKSISPAFSSGCLGKNIKSDWAYSDSSPKYSSLFPSDLEVEGLFKPAMLFLH